MAQCLHEFRIEVIAVLVGGGTGITEETMVAAVVDDPVELTAIDVGEGNGGGCDGGVLVDEGLHILHLLHDERLHHKNDAVSSFERYRLP